MPQPIDLSSLTPSPSASTFDSSVEEDEVTRSSATQKLMGSFRDVLTDKLNQVDSIQQDAHSKMKQFAAGEIENVHDVTIALQKADMALNLATMFREKILTAYNELKQLQ